MAISGDWYRVKQRAEPLDQRDLVCGCPQLRWKNPHQLVEGRKITAQSVVVKVDAVVLTQTCDLEQKKVQDVVVCPAWTLGDFRPGWEAARTAAGKQPTDKAWNSYCQQVQKGKMTNLFLLQAYNGDVSTDFRIVDFHGVFTVPLSVLEALAELKARLALSSPQREAVNQRFAHSFSRIGLPDYRELPW